MATYIVRFTPMEPYFFGNEKNFLHPSQQTTSQMANAYFIRSETVPSQTTLFGAIRYALLPVKKARISEYDENDRKANADAVGKESFHYGKQQTDFGRIEAMSPIVLMDEHNDVYVVTPFDHIHGEKTYKPFKEFVSVQTPQGERLCATEYNAKEGVEHSYMRLGDGAIVSHHELFRRETRVGVNRLARQSGFFKKEYVRLKAGYSFAVYLTLKDDAVPEDTVAFLGQGRAMFNVSFEKCGDTAWKAIEDTLRGYLREGVQYCFSDAFVESTVYEKAVFAVTATRDHRAFTTDSNGRITKHSVLHKLLSAGSVLQGEDIAACFNDPYAQIVGFNHII